MCHALIKQGGKYTHFSLINKTIMKTKRDTRFQMSRDTLTFLDMRPGESVTVPISECVNARAKLSKLQRTGKGKWTTRIDKSAGVLRVVRM